MNTKVILKQLAMDSEMDYFGVSDIARMQNLPKGRRPQDFVPKAKSVIVLGKKIPQGPLTAQRNAFEGKRIQILSYTMYCVNKLNFMLNAAALKMARRIEKDYKAVSMPMPAGEPHNEEKWQSVMSNRYAAFCAGLGEMTWSGFVATPEAGPRIMWVSIVTELELPADPLYSGPKLCDPKTCGKCVDICPVKALSRTESITVKAGDVTASYGKRNKPLCRCAVKGLVKGTPGRLQMDVPHNANMQSMEDWYTLTKKDDPWQRMEFNHGNYCLRCMTECPIGRDTLHTQGLKDTLHKMATSFDMDLFGVGSVDRWVGAPIGHRPNDCLPSAKSVIVMGVKIPEGCIRENMIAYRGMRHGILPYMVYGYNMLNDLMEDAALKIADYLNSLGYETFLPPASVGREEDKMMGIISNRHSAVAAGLAEFGLNGLALTPEAGPRVRWVIIVTNAALPADPLYHGPKLCLNCKHCVNICPVHAFNPDERWHFKIADKDCSYCKLNRVVCRTAQTGIAKGSSRRLQKEINKKEVLTVNDWLKLVKSDDKWNRLERVAAMCGRCMIECPVGREEIDQSAEKIDEKTKP